MSVKAKFFGDGTNFNDRYIPDYEELQQRVEHLKGLDVQIVLTQGVYDLLHIGHAAYLEKAKSFGDVLIVGVDSDELTRKRKSRKGEKRPMVPHDERMKMLAHLRHVDIITTREDTGDLDDLVKVVCPDVLVVSESTTDFPASKYDSIRDLCGRIEVLPPQATTSTTARIRDQLLEGAQAFEKEFGPFFNDLTKEMKKQVYSFMEDFRNSLLQG